MTSQIIKKKRTRKERRTRAGRLGFVGPCTRLLSLIGPTVGSLRPNK